MRLNSESIQYRSRKVFPLQKRIRHSRNLCLRQIEQISKIQKHAEPQSKPSERQMELHEKTNRCGIIKSHVEVYSQKRRELETEETQTT